MLYGLYTKGVHTAIAGNVHKLSLLCNHFSMEEKFKIKALYGIGYYKYAKTSQKYLFII